MSKKRNRAPRRCWNGCPVNKSSAKFCTSCGEQLGLTYGQHVGQHLDRVAKACDPVPGTYWGDRARREVDPGQREIMLKMARSEAGGAPAFIAKAAGGVW